MSLNTLEVAYANGQVIDASHINELTLALLGQFVGRDANGVPTPNQSLGTLAIPWGNLYCTGIILNNEAIDTSQITAKANRIVSGATRSLSSMPDFIRANGAALEFDVLGATTELVLSINNTAVTVSSDLTKTGITPAPSTNNTADINDTTVSNDLYVGEDGRDIIIDAVGSEITSLVGQIAAFETPTGEIFTGLIKDSTTITNVFRGYYFDNGGSPIERGNLSNNDTITLLKLGWVFLEDNGATIDVSYRTPSVSYTAPSSPATGDYWFDISNQVWKRYSGTSFEIINRMLIGQIVSDSTNTIASRSADFTKEYSEQNNIKLDVFSGEIIKTRENSCRVNVYGTEIEIGDTKIDWNITTDLETGVSEAASTYYYLYLSDEGQAIISDIRYHDRKDLKGKYHPYHSWRYIGECYNDSSNDLVSAKGDIEKYFARYSSDSGQTVTALANIIYEDKERDNGSEYNASTGIYTSRSSKRIRVVAGARPNSGTTMEVNVNLNNGTFKDSGKYGGTTADVCRVVSEFDVKFGDQVEIQNGLGASRTLISTSLYNVLTISEVENEL